MSVDPRLDLLIQSYFESTPVLEWSYVGFLETMKPHLNSAQGSLDKRKSIWRKRFLTFLTSILVDEEEQKIYDDNSKTRFEIATLLVQQKHPPEATSFWENFELERQLAIKEDIFDKKSQIDALNVLDASRSQKSNEYIGKVNSSSGQKRKKKNLSLPKDSTVSKKAKTISGDVEDDDPFININRAEGSTEMTSGINEVNSPGYDRPQTPPHQIRSTSKDQDLLKQLRQEKQRAKSMYEPICSNIIDTTNKPLMNRLKIKRDYIWDPVTNEATKYIDELIDNSDTRDKFRSKLQLSFVPPNVTYSFSKHYEIKWVHRFADKLSSFFEAPRNPLLDKNSEGWLNCHILTSLIDDCFLTCEEIQVHRGEEMSLASIERKNLSREESGKKQAGHKIDILFRIDDMEYFGSETYVDEDPHNSKPISYKQKLFREMKDQLDRLLKKLNFTKETIKGIKNITIHGINQGGLNGKIYAMYYDADLQYYFVFETCRYRIGTTWGSIPESLMSLKDILCLKSDITNTLNTVKKTKRIALRTNSKDLFTINNLPETTPSPKKGK